MKTQPKHSRWKLWMVGGAVTALVGTSLFLSSGGETGVGMKASGGKGEALDGEMSLAAFGKWVGRVLGRSVEVGGKGGGPFEALPIKGGVKGSPLMASGMNPDNDKGRVAKLDRSRVGEWFNLQEGAEVVLPSLDGEPLLGRINLRMEDNGWLRFGGELQDREGSFTLNTNADEVAGVILLPESGRAYEIRSDASGEIVEVERRLSSLICWPYSMPGSAAAATTTSSSLTIAAGGKVPEINTRPGAKGVIYVDFDGETVTEPSWNSGRTITAAPSALTADQIREVVARVAEDYAPFDIAISTIRSDYDSMPVGRRMRVIVTPTSTAAPGGGGVSMVNSWSSAGRWMSSTIPAWVFNSSVKAVAEAVSHEAGHTFGLNHDGTVTSEYYSGHGGGLDVPTSWAPIMGNSYSRFLTQWSRGEYKNANNTEDDLAIISSPTNGFGYRSAVNPSNSLVYKGNEFEVSGMLLSSAATDTYEFQTTGGSVTASVLPSSVYGNIDLRLELRDASDKTLATSSPVDGLGASVSKTGLAAGNYRLLVHSAGTGAAPVGGYVTGYSEYGSIGGYKLTGSIGNAVVLPSFTSASMAVGTVGKTFSFVVTAGGGASISGPTGTIPPGLAFDGNTKTFSGIPLSSGSWALTFTASAGGVTAQQVLTIRVDDVTLPLADALGQSVSQVVTGPSQAPWTGVSVTRADGNSGIVAVSGRVLDGGLSRMQFSVPGQSVLSFWWRTSSEAGKDGLVLKVNGLVARDASTGKLTVLSGESGWVQQRVSLDRPGLQAVEVVYQKDSSVSAGQDRGWLYGVTISKPPVFKDSASFPWLLVLKTGETSFSLSLEAEGATSYQWKKDGVSLVDGVSGTHTVSGATTTKLTVSGAVAADSGFYTLEATNGSGTVSSRRAEVVVAGAPKITQPPVAPIGLKAGSPFQLSVTASGTGPIMYMWAKDGRTVQWGTSPVYQVRSAKVGDAGKYVVYAVNRYGLDQSAELQVSVAAATAKGR